jgi:hypothetical protein
MDFDFEREPFEAIQSYRTFLDAFGFGDTMSQSNGIGFDRYCDDFVKNFFVKLLS